MKMLYIWFLNVKINEYRAKEYSWNSEKIDWEDTIDMYFPMLKKT